MRTNGSSKRARKQIGFLGVFFLACGLLVVLLVLLLGGRWVQSARRVETALERIRDAGEPVTPQDLEAYYQYPPAEEDATSLWIQACRRLDSQDVVAEAGDLPIVGKGQGEIPPPGQPWPALEEAERFLERHRISLELLHAAAERGGSARYPANFARGDDMLVPECQALRGGARLLALEAHVRAHRGDPPGAAEAIHSIFVLAGSLEKMPALIPQLIRNALDGVAENLIEDLLPTVEFSDEDLRRLQADLRAADYQESLRRAMLGERVTGILRFQDPTTMGLSGVGARAFRLTQRGGFVEYLGLMEEMIAAAKKPWPEPVEAVEQEARRTEEEAQGRVSFGDIGRVLTALMVPAIERFYAAMARGAATNDAADAAIAVELYRREHSKLPESLEKLVPEFLREVPIDPFDGRPLRYTVRDEEYVIYSVGKDRTDDGGHGDESGEPDIVFRITTPSATQAGETPGNLSGTQK